MGDRAQGSQGSGQDLEEACRIYRERYRGYTFRVVWQSSAPYDPKKEAVDVRLSTRDGFDYVAAFATLEFIRHMFEKNKVTRECASGTYFCMPGMIVVEEITEPKIKAVIDDLVNNLEVENYFRKTN